MHNWYIIENHKKDNMPNLLPEIKNQDLNNAMTHKS